MLGATVGVVGGSVVGGLTGWGLDKLGLGTPMVRNLALIGGGAALGTLVSLAFPIAGVALGAGAGAVGVSRQLGQMFGGPSSSPKALLPKKTIKGLGSGDASDMDMADADTDGIYDNVGLVDGADDVDGAYENVGLVDGPDDDMGLVDGPDDD